MPKAEMLSKLMAKAAFQFSKAGLETPELDAKLLLQYVNGYSSPELISKSSDILDVDKTVEFWKYVERRLNHEPVHRILGCREFYGREFCLSDDTLIPRPDTETLVEAVIDLKPSSVLEIGTGSGAIAVSLAAELVDVAVTATDISPGALETAKKNANALGVKEHIHFLKSDIYEDVKDKFDLIVSNPPYIPAADILTLQKEVRVFDPMLALDGGEDGLDFYRRILGEGHNYLKPKGKVCLEIGIDQEKDISALAVAAGFSDIIVIKDLNQINRVIIATL